MSSFNHQECLGCGQPYEGPSRGGFCLFCASNSEISFNPNPNSFDDSQNLFDYSSQPQYETHPYELCGNDSHYGYDYPPREYGSVVGKERILKLIQAWDEKQIESWSFQELLSQFLNDSRSIEQAANLAIQKEQEEQEAQSFTPYWNFSMIDDEKGLQSREKFMKDIQTFLQKFNRYPFGVMPKEYLENSSNAITPVLPIEEPEYSLSMGYEHLNTIPEMKSDEVIESSAKNLLPIPSEYKVTSDDESECNVPVKDEFSSVFTTFSNPLFNDNDDFTSSDDESLSDEDVPIKDFKVYSNPLFDDDEINSDKLDPHYFNAESDIVESFIVDEERIRIEHKEYISLMEKLFSINSFPRPLENFHTNTIIEIFPTSPIPVEDGDSLREEIDIFTGTDDLLPLGIESDDYNSEEDIYFLEELLVNDSIRFPENESSDFDHQDDPSFQRPPPKPPGVEFFFDLEPNSGELISVVINNIDELNIDECFDPEGEIDVFANVEDDDYSAFTFVIRIFLPYLIYPEVSPLPLSIGSEDTIFDPGIFV
nr:hypothetical protein [Tanacetum cinerariifolium]